MNSRRSNDLRSAAYFFSIVLRGLSLASVVGTIFVTYKVSQLNTTLGITNSQDPATWIVLVSGSAIAVIFAAGGYALGILCAIYDRQSLTSKEVGALALQFSSDFETQSGRNHGVRGHVVQKEVVEPSTPKQNVKLPPLIETESFARSTLGNIPAGDSNEPRGVLWARMTRERHVFRKREN